MSDSDDISEEEFDEDGMDYEGEEELLINAKSAIYGRSRKLSVSADNNKGKKDSLLGKRDSAIGHRDSVSSVGNRGSMKRGSSFSLSNDLNLNNAPRKRDSIRKSIKLTSASNKRLEQQLLNRTANAETKRAMNATYAKLTTENLRRKIESISVSKLGWIVVGLKSGELVRIKNILVDILEGTSVIPNNTTANVVMRLRAKDYNYVEENMFRPISPVDINKYLIRNPDARGSVVTGAQGQIAKPRRGTQDEISNSITNSITTESEKQSSFRVTEKTGFSPISCIHIADGEDISVAVTSCADGATYITTFLGDDIEAPTFEGGDILYDGAGGVGVQGSITHCCCSSDGRIVVTADVNGNIRIYIPELWDVSAFDSMLVGGTKVVSGSLITKLFIDEDSQQLVSLSTGDWIVWDLSKIVDFVAELEADESDDDEEKGSEGEEEAASSIEVTAQLSMVKALLPTPPQRGSTINERLNVRRSTVVGPRGGKPRNSIADIHLDQKMVDKIDSINKLFG